MIPRSRRTLTACTTATLMIGLATMGGYRLAGSIISLHRHVGLAVTTAATWVSATGNNANAITYGCDRAHTCLDLSGALQATGAKGEVLVVDPVASNGPVSISTALTIDGLGGTNGQVFSFGAEGIIVNAGPSDVVV